MLKIHICSCPTLYLVMKFLNRSGKLCFARIITVKLKAIWLLNVSLHIRPLTFIAEALRLVGTVGYMFFL